jgi:lipoate-protein ligase A
MKFRWVLRDGEVKSAQSNMEEDGAALQAFSENDPAVLRFYAWKRPSATYGHFINPQQYFDEAGLLKHHVDIAKRPTGGGILFHHVDISFSILIPKAHPYFGTAPVESYWQINSKIKKALVRSGVSFQTILHEGDERSIHEKFCMAHPTIFDLVISGKKIAGGAQRRAKHALLHQGSLCLTVPDKQFYEEVLKPNPKLIAAFQQISYPLNLTANQIANFKQALFEELSLGK